MNVRKTAIGFALISTSYWMMVQGLWSFVIEVQLVVPSWQKWLSGSLPPMIYAVFCLFFCNRLARAMGLAARQQTFQ